MPELFIYGNLKVPEVQKQVIGRETVGYPTAVTGYAKSTIEIEGENYPALVPKENSKVFGFVIDINDDELQRVDDFETDAYDRIVIKTHMGKSVMAYVKSTRPQM